ncbi:MAG: hypothetical protein IPN16_21600 [Gemmatimonadetes bacterium]|nr:hypothetical protein [Gemmatimonadota bacterium]
MAIETRLAERPRASLSSYFSKFPTFEGFGWPYHFHAVIALVWICMLITQAFLIRAKQYRYTARWDRRPRRIPLLLLVLPHGSGAGERNTSLNPD